jgi:hypothetical protein
VLAECNELNGFVGKESELFWSTGAKIISDFGFRIENKKIQIKNPI